MCFVGHVAKGGNGCTSLPHVSLSMSIPDDRSSPRVGGARKVYIDDVRLEP